MISPAVRRQYSTWAWPDLPMNVCSHCGDQDCPEDTRHWPEDEDGDRICHPCAEQCGIEPARPRRPGLAKAAELGPEEIRLTEGRCIGCGSEHTTHPDPKPHQGVTAWWCDRCDPDWDLELHLANLTR